jgi:pimeloyl-ACP methyl ester carboxylesterase
MTLVRQNVHGADAGTRAQTVSVWHDQVRIRVVSKGNGPAVVFFHGPWGLAWDPFLDELARRFTVYAPEHPGTTPETPDDAGKLDGLWDLVLCYDELLDALGLASAFMVGHSFGAMVACEMAAAYPDRARRLALIDPLGFWRDSDPVVNWMIMNPGDVPAQIFRDPSCEAAQRMFGTADDPTARVRVIWAMGATGKFIWPIPDKGLKKRIHRLKAPALLIWGRDDRLVPAVYAEEFAKRIAGAQVQMIDAAGHAPQVEQPEAVARIIREFLLA